MTAFYYGLFAGRGRDLLAKTLGALNPFNLPPAEILSVWSGWGLGRTSRMRAAGGSRWEQAGRELSTERISGSSFRSMPPPRRLLSRRSDATATTPPDEATTMATHRIYLGRQTGRSKATPCSLELDGPEIVRSVQPIYDCARYLLDSGIAQPDDIIETYRGSTMSMSGRIGRCAEFSVSETDRGLRLVPFRPFPGPATAPAEEDLRSIAATMAIAGATVDR